MATSEIKQNPIIDAAAKNAMAQASAATSALEIHKQLDAYDSIAEDMTGSFQTIGKAQALQVGIKSGFEAEVDAGNAAAQLALSSDWKEQGSDINKWARLMRENAQKSYDSLDVIQEKQQYTLLDNPLGWINAQFTLPADIATHNYYASKHNEAEANLDKLSSATNAAAIANKNMEKNTSQELAIARQEEVVAAQAVNVGKLKLDTAGTRIKGIVELNQLTAQQSQLAYQALNAQNEQVRLSLAQRSAEDQHQMRLIAQQQRQDVLDAKKADRLDLEYLLEARNAGARNMGKTTIDSVDLFKREYLARKSDPDYQDMVNSGQIIQSNGGVVSGVMVAKNAGDAARNYASPGTSLKGNVAGTFLATVYNTEKLSPTASKDKVAFNEHVNQIAVGQATAQSKLIKDDQPNIYAAPNPAILLKNPNVASNNFIKDSLLPMVTLSPEMSIDDNTLVSSGIDYVKGDPGKLAAVTAGITQYYRQAVLTNNMVNRYKENGLPEQLKYVAQIGGQNVDLADELSVKRIVLTGLVKQSGLSIIPRLGAEGVR